MSDLALFPARRPLSIQSAAIPQVAGEDILVPTRLIGSEGINQLFEYHLTLQTSDSMMYRGIAGAIELDTLLGKELSCTIELEGMGTYTPGQAGASGAANQGAGQRQINGLITQARFVGQGERHAVYELTLRPWLHLATLRSDCKIFQNCNAIEVIQSILSHYSFAAEKRLIETYPVRDYCVQYNETDFEFLSRLFQENGISYHFEHSAGVHRLIYSDHNGAYHRTQKDNPHSPYHTIPYYPPNFKIDREYIHQFSATHAITSGRFSARDYDYTQARAQLTVSASHPRPTDHAQQERYLWRGRQASLHGADYSQPQAGAPNPEAPAGIAPSQDQGQHYARQRIELLRQEGQRAQGQGHIRGIVPGHSFTLSEHPHSPLNREYIVLHTHLTLEVPHQTSQANANATNNPSSVPLRILSDSERLGSWRIHTQFEVQPSTEILRPAFTQDKPLIGGMETARVCGPDDDTAQSNIYTDAYGRIKIQFPWDRYGTHNHHSSCWVRVASHWAGNQLGSISTPRIGQEVIVGFLSGDPDLPIVTGSVYNQLNLPPWQLASQQALTGLRSRELTNGGGNSAAGRSNHLILDDTHHHIQVQLKSDHQSSQLSLGSITRIEDNQGRTDARGEGFELRSDAPGAIRANGLLVSTEVRNKAVGKVKDMEETLERLAQASQQHEASGETAEQFQAQDANDQQQVASALAAQLREIQGPASTAPKQSASSNASDTPHFPELSQPHLVWSSPAGIEATTSKSTHWAAGEHIALTSGEHTSISSGKSLLATAAQAIRVVAGQNGMNFIAIDGDVNIKALERSLNILAQLEITQTADRITIAAKKDLQLIGGQRVLINGGGSTSQWQGSGVVHETSGDWVEHAASHNMPKSLNAPLAPGQTQAPFSLQYRLRNERGDVLPHTPYQLTSPRGKVVVAGVTDHNGLTARHYTLTKSTLRLKTHHNPGKK